MSVAARKIDYNSRIKHIELFFILGIRIQTLENPQPIGNMTYNGEWYRPDIEDVKLVIEYIRSENDIRGVSLAQLQALGWTASWAETNKDGFWFHDTT